MTPVVHCHARKTVYRTFFTCHATIIILAQCTTPCTNSTGNVADRYHSPASAISSEDLANSGNLAERTTARRFLCDTIECPFSCAVFLPAFLQPDFAQHELSLCWALRQAYHDLSVSAGLGPSMRLDCCTLDVRIRVLCNMWN